MIRNFILICLAVYAAEAIPTAPKALLPSDYRIPLDEVEVQNYKITLTLTEQTLTDHLEFKGTADITIKLTKTLDNIKLHSKVQSIDTVQLFSEDNQEILIDESSALPNPNPDTNIYTITPETPSLEQGTYIIKFEYTGKLSATDMYGFYRSSYKDTNGDDVYLATTQFQPSYARRAFPCFDEPSLKATFDITIVHPSHLTALGNTEEADKTIDTASGMATTTFATTPKMSTYLVAFIISDFTCDESVEKLAGGISHFVCSREETKASRKYALDVTPKLVKALEDYTNRPYQTFGIKKLHQVAIPDFAAGAMENWGLITYRETALLWDDSISNSYKQRVGTVITHELAHQWFGNLLTTHWWSDTFLNEGFATFFEAFSTALVETDWQLEKQFVIDDVQYALNADGQATSHALSHEVGSLSEINSRFSTISYSKGGTILRMLESIMGKDKFQAGLRSYLNEHAYKETTVSKLLNSLQTQIGDSTIILTDVMTNWIETPGYPVLNVKENNNTHLEITQKRFLYSGEAQPADQWTVPITYTKSSDVEKFENTLPQEWLKPSEPLVIEKGTDASWIILNNQQTGFYRVNYDETLLANIKKALTNDNFGEIAEINRAQIVDDLFNLARVKTIEYSTVLDFITFLKNETSYSVWKAAFSSLSLLRQRIANDTIKDALATLILDLMDTLFKSVPFDQANSANHIFTLNQVQAHNWACSLGHADCIATQEFEKYKSDDVKPNPNFQAIIYCNALRQSKDPRGDWDFLWQKFEETKSATEIVTLISSLGCVKNSYILNEYLKKSITETSGIRRQDALSVFSSVYSSGPEGIDVALDFLTANYKEISSYYGGLNVFTSIFSGIATRIVKDEHVKKLEDFAQTPILDSDIKKTVEDAVKTINTNLAWTSFLETQIGDYLIPTITDIPPTDSPTVIPPTDKPDNSALAAQVGFTIIISCAAFILFMH